MSKNDNVSKQSKIKREKTSIWSETFSTSQKVLRKVAILAKVSFRTSDSKAVLKNVKTLVKVSSKVNIS